MRHFVVGFVCSFFGVWFTVPLRQATMKNAATEMMWFIFRAHGQKTSGVTEILSFCYFARLFCYNFYRDFAFFGKNMNINCRSFDSIYRPFTMDTTMYSFVFGICYMLNWFQRRVRSQSVYYYYYLVARNALQWVWVGKVINLLFEAPPNPTIRFFFFFFWFRFSLILVFVLFRIFGINTH